MFPVDSLPSMYCEDRAAERAAAEAAKRLAKQQQDQAQQRTAFQLTNGPAPSPSQSSQPLQQSALHRSLMHRPTLSRGASGGFLGNLLQEFARTAAAGGSSRSGAAQVPVSTVTSPAVSEKSEAEAMRSVAQRDLNMCATRAW